LTVSSAVFRARRLTFKAEAEQEIRMTRKDTLGGWDDRGKAAYFLEKTEIIVPKRREQLCFLMDLLPWSPQEPLRILDIGSGYGAIAEEILMRYTHSALTCVDGSDEISSWLQRLPAVYAPGPNRTPQNCSSYESQGTSGIDAVTLFMYIA
jgi:hypothetical protein